MLNLKKGAFMLFVRSDKNDLRKTSKKGKLKKMQGKKKEVTDNKLN